MVNKLFTLFALAGALTAIGCGGPTNRRVDANEEAMIDARGVQDDDFVIAARDLSKKISEKTARGWPGHLLLSEDGTPVVRVHKIKNKSRLRMNLVDIYNNVYNELVNQGAVYVVSGGDDLEAVNMERDYSETETVDEIQRGMEDKTTMIIAGEITQERIEQGDVEQYTTFFTLRLVDTLKNRMIIVQRTKVRKEREN
jgi:hypothetical protein